MIEEDCRFYLAKTDKKTKETRWHKMDDERGITLADDEIYEYLEDPNVEIGMLGDSFEYFKMGDKGERDIDKLLLKTRVYARFSPAQKQEVVNMLIEHGLVVGMCG